MGGACSNCGCNEQSEFKTNEVQIESENNNNTQKS